MGRQLRHFGSWAKIGVALGVALVPACLSVPPLEDDTDGTGATSATTAESASNVTSDSGATEPTSATAGTSAADTTSTTEATTEPPDTEGTVGGEPPPDFFDDFERPDSDDLGNGWAERSGGAWDLANGRVRFTGGKLGFRRNLFYRPELMLLDVEAQVEVELEALSPADFPQIQIRVSPDDVGVPGNLTSYGFYLNVASEELEIFRELGASGEMVAAIGFETPLTAATPYRLTFRAEGTDPVELLGVLEGKGDGSWSIVQELSFTDENPDRITESGHVGSSGNFNAGAIRYDNYSIRDRG